MIDTEEKKYVAELCSQTYGFYPRDVKAKQLNLPVATTVIGKFFVLSYASDAGGYVAFGCNGATVNTLIGSTSGIDGLLYTLVDRIETTGANVITGYEII